MNVVKLGKKGQLSLPKAVLTELGLQGDQLLIVDTTPEGTIMLRPAGVYPLESYSDERIEGFLAEDELSAEERRRLSDKLQKHWG